MGSPPVSQYRMMIWAKRAQGVFNLTERQTCVTTIPRQVLGREAVSTEPLRFEAARDKVL
jgi:hypothetical protein